MKPMKQHKKMYSNMQGNQTTINEGLSCLIVSYKRGFASPVWCVKF